MVLGDTAGATRRGMGPATFVFLVTRVTSGDGDVTRLGVITGDGAGMRDAIGDIFRSGACTIGDHRGCVGVAVR